MAATSPTQQQVKGRTRVASQWPGHCHFPCSTASEGFIKGLGEGGCGEIWWLGCFFLSPPAGFTALCCFARRRQKQRCATASEPPELASCSHFARRRHCWHAQGSFSISYNANPTPDVHPGGSPWLIHSTEAASSALRVPELMYQAGSVLFLKAPSPLAESKGNPSSPAPLWCCFTAFLYCLKDLLLFFFGCRIYCPH